MHWHKKAPNLWYHKVTTTIKTKKGADFMINQMNANDHTENQFFHALKELQIAKLLHKSNITKSCGVSAYEVFQFLLLLIFQGKNLFRFLNSICFINSITLFSSHCCGLWGSVRSPSSSGRYCNRNDVRILEYSVLTFSFCLFRQ